MNPATFRSLALILVLGAVFVGCGKWQRVGREQSTGAGQFVPRLFDAGAIYRGMDLVAAEGPIPFVGGVRFLAGRSHDSTLALIGLYLTNNLLSFRRVGEVFEAHYRVDVRFRSEAGLVLSATRDDTVRTATMADTRDGSKGVVFQHSVLVPPGTMFLGVTVRDLDAEVFSEAEIPVTVPAYREGPRLSSLIPVFGAVSRSSRTEEPDMVVNPRASAPFGVDTLRLYIEAYDVPDGESIVFRAITREPEAEESWRDSIALGPGGSLRGLLVLVETEKLPLGELYVEAFIPATGDTVRTTVLVAFSEHWATANFDEAVSLLRYFGADRALQEMRDAAPADRLGLWRDFWSDTDPDPLTPNHEGFDLYFRRVQVANSRFRERDTPGWLTDRGEVFVTIGAPDEIWDSSSDVEGGGRYVRWIYISGRATLYFVDDTGYGVFILTSRSRSDFMEVVNRMRRSG